LQVRSEFERLSAGGERSEVERKRFQEVARRLDELKRATTGSRQEFVGLRSDKLLMQNRPHDNGSP